MISKIVLGCMFFISTVFSAEGTTPVPTIYPPTVLIFVSEATFLGDGTQAVMDTTCWQEANGQTVGQEFKAAVANIQANPSDVYSRLPNGVIINSRGVTIAADKDALFPRDGSTDGYGLADYIYEIDGEFSGKHSWTGSASLLSIASGADCTGWTSTNGIGVAGNSAVDDANWWLEFFDFCNGQDGEVITENAVYCFQEYQGSGVVLDPVFDGFDGSHFEFQGLPNQIFNMISTKNFQMNTKFVEVGHGSAIGAIGLKVGSEQIYIDGNSTVLFNGELVKDTIIREDFELELKEKNIIRFSYGPFEVEMKLILTRLDLKFAVRADKIENEVHGLIGQTLNHIGEDSKLGEDNMGTGAIEGEYADYLEDSIFSTSSLFSKFASEQEADFKKSSVFADSIFSANLRFHYK